MSLIRSVPQQTCALFRPVAGAHSGTVVLKSRQGLCRVDSNAPLSCRVNLSEGTEFSNVSFSHICSGILIAHSLHLRISDAKGSVLGYAGNSAFSADSVPASKGQTCVYVGSGHPEPIRLVYVALTSSN